MPNRLSSWRHSQAVPVLLLFVAEVNANCLFIFLIVALPRLLQQFYCHDFTVDDGEANVTTIVCDHTTISHHIGFISGFTWFAGCIVSPIVGGIIHIIGPSTVFTCSALLQLCGVVALLIYDSEWLLMLGIFGDGVGGLVADIAGMTIVATHITHDADRIRGFSLAQNGITVGLLIGYFVHGILFDYFGKAVPILVSAGLLMLDLLMRFLLPPLTKDTDEPETNLQDNSSFRQFVCDPYVLGLMGIPLLITAVASCTLATLPHHLITAFGTSMTMTGVIFVIATVLETATRFIISFAVKSHRVRILTMVVGLLLEMLGLSALNLGPSAIWYTAPWSLVRIGHGAVLTLLSSMQSFVVDARGLRGYHHVYALVSLAKTLGFALGPMLGGWAVTIIGFQNLTFCMAALLALAIPVLVGLSRLSITQEVTESSSLVKPNHEYEKVDVSTSDIDKKAGKHFYESQDDPAGSGFKQRLKKTEK